MVRDASGDVNDTISSLTGECLGVGCNYGWNFTECMTNKTCTYGLSNYYQVPLKIKKKKNHFLHDHLFDQIEHLNED